MLNSSMTYPYPLLRSEPIDFKNTIFNADIIVKTLQDGYEINVEYKLNNPEVLELIKQESVKFALEIQCVSTWYRELIFSNSSTQVVILKSSNVHERVDLCPCIVACDDLPHYFSSDFAEEYIDIATPINKGEVIAIGERKKFDALYKDDIIKKSDSIVQFKKDDNASTMHCEWEFPTIQIHLPGKQYELYDQIGKNEPWKIPLLNAIFVVPVLVEAVTIIHADLYGGGNNGLSEYAWYKTLKYMVGKIANNDDNKNRKLLADPLGTTQLLLNDNAKESLEILSKVRKIEEG